MKISKTIIDIETKGNCNLKGLSGENSCSQYMPNTWKLFSNEVLGYEAPLTPTNDLYVTSYKVQDWLDEGRSLDKIFLSWNAGSNATKCSVGKNKKGAFYDSCSYIKKGIIAYNSISN